MTNRRMIAVLTALACGWAGSAEWASATPESRAAVLFLLIKPGARASGMGETYVAIADDATATYFNPAALAGQTQRKLNFTHQKWLPGLADDMSYEFLAYSQPLEGWGNVGLHATLMNLGEQIRTGERGEVLGTFASYDLAFSGAYGADIGEDLAAGIGLKFIRSHLADYGAGIERGKGTGSTFAADLGLLWHATPALTFGAALRNLGPKIDYIDPRQADPLPQHLVLGAAYDLMEAEYHTLLLSADVYKPLIDDGHFAKSLVTAWVDESMGNEVKEMDLHAGGEYRYGLSAVKDESFLAMRAGYFLDHDGELRSPTFGLGLKYTKLQIDWAYIIGEGSDKGTPLQDTNRFSLNLYF